MKKLLIIILFPFMVNAQPPKLDSVVLGNENVNWSKGVPTIKGFQNLKYNQVWGSYMSADANSFGQVGQYNVAIGQNAFENNQTGNYNTAIGKDCLKMNTGGRDNVAMGYDALYNNTSGSANVAMPQDALFSNTIGSNNVALGRGSQYTSQRANGNVSLGFNTLYYNQTGAENVSLGHYSGGFLEKGDGNIFIGAYAGELNDAAAGRTINDMIAIGRYTGLSKGYSGSISIGYNIQPTGDNKINIGNTIFGDISTGDVAAKSFTISGRKITVDDNYLYVTTSTGVIKKVPLQDLSTTTTQQPIGFKAYNAQGQLLFYQPIYKN